MLIQGTNHIRTIADLIYRMDCSCRTDFKRNFIVSERDYVSLFLNHIRHPFGIFSNTSFAHSQTLPGGIEQSLGCDGIIIFKLNNNYKIGLFEAKVIKKYWDSSTGRPRISRFQRQINKQSSINPNIAVWEMFLNKNELKPYLDPLASSCVKRSIAQAYRRSSLLWSFNDLLNLNNQSYISNGSNPLNIRQIITEILSCNFGTLLNASEDKIQLFENDNDLRIPIIQEEVTENDINEIFQFLKMAKIHSYTHIDLGVYVQNARAEILGEI